MRINNKLLHCNVFSLLQHSPSSNSEEPMDTSHAPVTPTEVPASSPILTSLDKGQDNFESLLLLLLRAYTLHGQHPSQPGSESTSLLSPPPPQSPDSASQEVPISGRALETLSSEQIKTLVTSNSVNYEVIQQILAEQRGRPAIATAPRIGGENGSGGGEGGKLQDQQVSLLDELQAELSKTPSPIVQSAPLLLPPPPPSSSSSTATTTSAMLPKISDTNQQLQQLIQITPQQLQLLQTQVNDLLQTQRVTLPTDLNPEQQQQLIQTLLLRQLHLQQTGGVSSISLRDGSTAVQQLLAESGGEGGGGASEQQGKELGVEMTVGQAVKTVGGVAESTVSGGGSLSEGESQVKVTKT